jgi:glycosyltransferase involved in cell wall biosynthesis
MHVVQALVSMNIGGSELVATELTEYLTARGHQVTVAASGGPLAERIEKSGAIHLDWPIGKKRLATLKYIGRLSRWMGAERPDVVHAHSRLPAWICRMAIRRLPELQRPHFVTSMHGHYSVNRYSAVMASGDRVVAVSDRILEYTLKNYPNTDPGRVIRIHGGISRSAFPFGYKPDTDWVDKVHVEFPELAGKRVLCLPGRLSRYKGHVDFIELLAALAADYPKLHGVVIGQAKPGSRYRDELEGLAKGYGISDRITFAGARLNIRDWLASSEIVFSLCSDPPEAFGRTVPESLHLGVPVIGWNHGGVAEVLNLMFPQGAVTPGDRAALLARTRKFLDQRPEVVQSDRFGLNESMRQTLALYQSLCQRESSSQ